MDRQRSGRRLAAVLRLADVVAAASAAGSFQPQSLPAHLVARMVGRVGRLHRSGMARMAKVVPEEGLAKRTPGAPLTAAELEQRRNAARKQRDRTYVGAGAAAAAGALGGAIVGVPFGRNLSRIATEAADNRLFDARIADLRASNARFDVEREGRKLREMEHPPRRRGEKKPITRRSLVPYDPAATIVPKRIAMQQDKVRASVDEVSKLDAKAARDRMIAGRYARFARPALIAGPILGAAAMASVGYRNRKADDIRTAQEFEDRWQRRIDEARAAEKAAPSGRLAKGWGAALSIGSMALPMLTETQTGQRAMRWTGKKIGSAWRAMGGTKRAAAKVRRGARAAGAGINSQRATLASGAAAGGTYLMTRDYYRDREA